MNGKRKFYVLLGLFQLVLVLTVFLSVAAVLALSAAISLAASVLGSAMAIRTVGTAAISSLSEREESFFKAFLIVALCEALAVYGLIVAILLWTKIPTPI
ncbi:MAG: ATP synthase subunit C [Promethearchaeota archaeon]